MVNISVGRYTPPTEEQRAAVGPDVGWPSDRWQGWIIPEDNVGWRAFIGLDGVPTVFLD